MRSSTLPDFMEQRREALHQGGVDALFLDELHLHGLQLVVAVRQPLEGLHDRFLLQLHVHEITPRGIGTRSDRDPEGAPPRVDVGGRSDRADPVPAARSSSSGGCRGRRPSGLVRAASSSCRRGPIHSLSSLLWWAYASAREAHRSPSMACERGVERRIRRTHLGDEESIHIVRKRPCGETPKKFLRSDIVILLLDWVLRQARSFLAAVTI